MDIFYAIKISDNEGQQIGELMKASPVDILKYIEKGFTVTNKATNEIMTMDMVTPCIGVSDGFIDIG